MKLASRYNVLLVLLVLLAWSVNCTRASAADYTKVGVKVGNIADYKTSTDWGTYNRTSVLIYGVLLSGIVTLNITDYYPNGTIASKSQIILDLVIGGLASAYLIAGNLTAGDPIHVQTSMTINETVTMNFAGTPRTVNHLRLPDGSFEAYWDKATGLMTKLNWLLIGWLNMTIISTDAWPVAPPPPPPPVTPQLTVELSGEFDYALYEYAKVRLAALVKDAKTLIPVSGATVLIEIYYPNGTLWISGRMYEKLANTGIYEWESRDKIVKMKLSKGVYLTHVKAFVLNNPASDMLLFHIDPPPETESPVLTTTIYSVSSAIVLSAGIIALIFSIRRHRRLQVETALN